MYKMIMKVALGSALLGSSIFANECSLTQEESEMSCRGYFVARSLSDLEKYNESFGLRRSKARNLYVAFNLTGNGDLSIKSPCRVVFQRKRQHNWDGDICVNGKNGVYIKRYSKINAKNISLNSKKRIAIRKYSSIDATSLELVSSGVDYLSRVHIRHHAKVNVEILKLKAFRRATLGHSSTYNISENLEMSSVSDFSAIWRNSSIEAATVNIVSMNKVRLSKGTKINSSELTVEGQVCKLHKSVELESSVYKGNCLSEYETEVPPVVSSPNSYYKFDQYSSLVNFYFFPDEGDTNIVEAYYTTPDGQKYPVQSLTKGSVQEIQFFNLGDYDVTLTVIDDQGNVSEYTHSIKLLNLENAVSTIGPVIEFSATQTAALTVEVDMNKTFHPLKSSYTTFSIDFGDGHVVVHENVYSVGYDFGIASHTYAQPGNYEITVSADVQNGRGLSDKKLVIQVVQ